MYFIDNIVLDVDVVTIHRQYPHRLVDITIHVSESPSLPEKAKVSEVQISVLSKRKMKKEATEISMG